MAEDKPHLHVEFYNEAVENKRKSIEAGRPIFEDREMVRIRIAGDPKNTLIAPATDACGRDRETNLPITYKDKFPEHYRYFKDNGGAAIVGTPLTEVSWLTASKVAELKALSIFTVEALAQLDGSLLARIGLGARELKNQAQAWIDKSNGAVDAGRFADELSARDQIIEQLRRDIAALQSGEAPAPPAPEAPTPVTDAGLGENSPFWAWEDADIKNWIKDNGGAAPVGNPAHKTLVAKADALNDELMAKQQQRAA